MLWHDKMKSCKAEVPNLWNAAHYWAVASWASGCVNSWAVHVCARSTPPHASVATSVVWAATAPLVLHKLLRCHEPCTGGRNTSGRWVAVCHTKVAALPWTLHKRQAGGAIMPVVALLQAWRRHHKPHTGIVIAESLMCMDTAPFVWCAWLRPVCACACTCGHIQVCSCTCKAPAPPSATRPPTYKG